MALKHYSHQDVPSQLELLEANSVANKCDEQFKAEAWPVQNPLSQGARQVHQHLEREDAPASLEARRRPGEQE